MDRSRRLEICHYDRRRYTPHHDEKRCARHIETIKACVAYKIDGKETEEFPFEINDSIEPVYVELPGWKCDMTKMQSEDEFPEEFNAYISFLEEELQVPIKIVSVGPDREQTIVRYTEE